ncbi:MAG: hypothetical protein Alis3KO_32030 [Aliiglaciecola sp.]
MNISAMLLKLAKGLGLVNVRVALLGRNVAAILLVMMLIFILAQVLFRILENSLPWTEELSKYAMVWVACLVAPWAYRENLNVSIEMFADALPQMLRKISELAITILVALVSAIFFLESLDFWVGGLQINASSVPVKLAYFYSCAPFAFGGLFLIAIERGLVQLASIVDPDSVTALREAS